MFQIIKQNSTSFTKNLKSIQLNHSNPRPPSAYNQLVVLLSITSAVLDSNCRRKPNRHTETMKIVS